MLEDLLKRLSRIISPGARRGLGQSTEALKATGEGLLPSSCSSSSSSSSFFFFLLLVLRLRLLLLIIIIRRLLLLILILIELSLTFPKFLKPK